MSMPEPIFPWQTSLWEQLSAYIACQRIPQALLLYGPTGSGKRVLAEFFAAALMCLQPENDTRRACGKCQSCKLLAAQTHPDFLCIEPEETGKTLGVDRIRQLLPQLALKPQYPAYRIVLFQLAENMNRAAANAFLKSLEEPGERTSFLLISEQPGLLPATILSRCQKIACGLADMQAANDWLNKQNPGTNPELLLKICGGGPLLAKQYADNGLLTIRQSYFKEWLDCGRQQRKLLALAEQWQKQQHIGLSILMDWWSGWLGDIVKLAQGCDASQINNPDFVSDLQTLADQLVLKDVYQHYDKMLGSKALLFTQINKQLLLESLLIDWWQLNQDPMYGRKSEQYFITQHQR
jgi:DNA polymerase III subunit delta'